MPGLLVAIVEQGTHIGWVEGFAVRLLKVCADIGQPELHAVAPRRLEIRITSFIPLKWIIVEIEREAILSSERSVLAHSGSMRALRMM